jgi:hypothetical protein
MRNVLTDIAGWIPAVILPAATFLQLVKISRLKTARGVSVSTWFLFGLANLGLYFYTEKYFSLQSIFGLVGTAIMDFVIVGMIIVFRKTSGSTKEVV